VGELKRKNLLVLRENAEHEVEAAWFGVKVKIRFVPAHRWLASKEA
jgi:hypothetical protein